MNRNIRILFVDDEQLILNTMKRLFMNSRFDILTATSGEDGLEIMKNDSPVDIVVSDYRMPGMNGVEFLKIINARWPETIRIILSGYADTTNVLAAINDGQSFKVITKPWNDDDFKDIITDAAEKYKMHKNSMETLSVWKLIESLPLVMFRFDVDGNIVWMNTRAVEVFGEGLLKKNVNETLPEIRSIVFHAEDTGEASEHISINNRNYKAEASVLMKDGNKEGCVLVLDDRE